MVRCRQIIEGNKEVSFAYIERLYAKYGIQFPKNDEYKATFYNMPTSMKKGKKYQFEDEEDYKKA